MTEQMTRRTLLTATAAAVAAPTLLSAPAGAGTTKVPSAIRELEDKIQAAMETYAVPGVGLGVWYRGREYVRGFGVTSLADPSPVDGDHTVFRVASTTKTFTGTAVMRLAERGEIDLDRTVRSYLPDFRTTDPAASARVTVRQILDHSAGWLGDYFLDTGIDDDALARYVDGMARLPQLTAPGTVFSYNNAALSLSGRIIEVVTGKTYERAIGDLLLRPLPLRRSGFDITGIAGARMAVPHVLDDLGNLVPEPARWYVPRSLNPAGGLISSARDQIRWARFHLGDGGGLLTRRSLRRMRSRPGPGGTLFVELDGAGVTWMIRPTAEGPEVVQHGGDWDGQHSGFLMVPERDFALTVLTNSDTGPALLDDLFVGDWALSRLAGVHNLPAEVRPLGARQLAAYEGWYAFQQIGFDGEFYEVALEFTADAGGLIARSDGDEVMRLGFYRRDYAVVHLPDGTPTPQRVNFVRGSDGSVQWFRFGGRLLRHTPPSTLRTTATRPFPLRMPI
ncbi:penicillin-binding protein [Actinoplanes sp. OR16]|uniref:serine hydrolase domain-containing protein n=1 Tax=Actinoplanes sp. OR16 TaxID=946334 RepID=UPI000F7185DE|nr:serine hydrolase domain-containing protein [Actinoplanes sp. OR16]BBH67412.1 penicillin-binding protein [Actinoplanes sp. OR16]